MAHSFKYESDEAARKMEEATSKIRKRITVKAVMNKIAYRDIYAEQHRAMPLGR